MKRDRYERRLKRVRRDLPARPRICRTCNLPVAEGGLWGFPFHVDEHGKCLHEICKDCGRPFPYPQSRDPTLAAQLLGCGSKCYIGVDPNW